MKKYLIIFPLFFSFGFANGQVAGYLGKKINIGYNFNFNPVLNGIIGRYYNDAPTVFFATKHEANVGYTFSKKASLQVSYLNQNNKTYYYNSYDSYNNIQFAEGSNQKAHNKVITTVFDFGLRFQLGNFISPVGTYLDLNYGICKAGFDNNDAHVYYYDFSNGVNLNYINGQGTYINYKRVSIGVGNTKLLNDFLYLNVGIRVSKNYGYEYHKSSNAGIYSSDLLNFLEGSVRPMNWLEIKIGLGILL